MKFLRRNDDATSVRDLVSEVKAEQQKLAQAITDNYGNTERRVSAIISDLGAQVEKIETVIDRLSGVTDALLEQRDSSDRIKPWYVRVFCPFV